MNTTNTALTCLGVLGRPHPLWPLPSPVLSCCARSPPMALLHCCICHLLTVHWHEAPKDAWLGHIAGDVVHVAQYCSAAQTLIDAGSPMDFLNEATRDDPSWWVRQVKKACSEVQKDFEQWRKHGARPEAGGDASLPGVTEPAARDFPCAWCGARFRLRKHLGAHLARGDTCVSCLKCFRTVERHQSHLKRSDRCLLRTCRLAPCLSIEQVRELRAPLPSKPRRSRPDLGPHSPPVPAYCSGVRPTSAYFCREIGLSRRRSYSRAHVPIVFSGRHLPVVG